MFQYESRIVAFINKLVDVVYASFLWVLFCIPVVTAGAATTALYYTTRKSIRGNRGYVRATFWDSFKENFKESVLLTIILEAVFALITVDRVIMKEVLEKGGPYGTAYYFFIVLQFFVATYAVFLFAYRARFEQTWKLSMKNVVFLELLHLLKTILVTVILAVAAFAVKIMPLFLLFVPTLACLILDLVLEPIFRKYMTEEEREREQQLDMERDSERR